MAKPVVRQKPDALAILDVGTTSTRASVLRLDGSLIGHARELNRLEISAPDRAEHDPFALLGAAEMVVARAVRAARAAGAAVGGLVISSQMHSLLLTDAAGRPVTPIITWADTRADAAATAVRSRDDWLALYARTGCPPHPAYPLYKLMALRSSGEAPRPTQRVVDLKSWLLWKWTGESVIDLSLASGTALLDLHALRWDAEALEMAGISEAQLPTIVDTSHITPVATRRLGLPLGTPIVTGAGDAVLSSLGCGAHAPGAVAVMMGTSGAVRIGSPAPMADPMGRLFSYYLAPGLWIVGGALSSGGIVLDWLGRIFDVDHSGILDTAAGSPAGAGGLVFVPLIVGERAPGYEGRARGAWFGLGLEHDRRHLARAAIEGMAFHVRSVLALLEERSRVTEVRATGGLARSALWLRVLAGVINRTVTVPTEVEGSTIGALILGGTALGLLPNLDAASAIVHPSKLVEPEPGERAIYDATYASYQRLYDGFRPEFAALAALRASSTPGPT